MARHTSARREIQAARAAHPVVRKQPCPVCGSRLCCPPNKCVGGGLRCEAPTTIAGRPGAVPAGGKCFEGDSVSCKKKWWGFACQCMHCETLDGVYTCKPYGIIRSIPGQQQLVSKPCSPPCEPGQICMSGKCVGTTVPVSQPCPICGTSGQQCCPPSVCTPSGHCETPVTRSAATGMRVPGMGSRQRRALRAAVRGGRAPGIGRLAPGGMTPFKAGCPRPPPGKFYRTDVEGCVLTTPPIAPGQRLPDVYD